MINYQSPEFKRKLGFTLIELLVVMAILGLLSVLGIGNFQTARIKARDAKRKSDLSTIAKSLEAYANDHSQFPSSSDGKILCQSGVVCDWGNPFTDGKSTYTAELPEDENENSDYVYVSSGGTSYTLYARLENANDPAITTITPTVSCGTVDCNYKITSTNIQ